MKDNKNDFNLVPVSKVAKIFLGGTPKRSEPSYWGNGIKWASAADVTSCETRYIRQTTEQITELGLKNSAAKLLEKDTIVITARGTVGALCMLPEPMSFNQTCYGLVCHETINPTFFYFALKSRIGHIKSQTYGAVFETITIQSFDNILVPLPSLSVQQKISSILSAYDDLIENNTRRIKILEEMAQRIYKEWFIDFRFPGHEKVKFVDSELGKIPEGWEVKKIGELLSKIKRKPRIKKEDYLDRGSIPAIDQSTSFIGGYTNEVEALHSDPLPIIVFGDHTRIIKYIDFPFASGADGTQLLYPNNKDLMPAYFYYAIKNIDLSDFAYARHFKFLKEQKIIIPTSQILKNFNQLTVVFLNQMSLLRKKNDNLCQTRDLLLPKLISGELDVSDLDITIREQET